MDGSSLVEIGGSGWVCCFVQKRYRHERKSLRQAYSKQHEIAGCRRTSSLHLCHQNYNHKKTKYDLCHASLHCCTILYLTYSIIQLSNHLRVTSLAVAIATPHRVSLVFTSSPTAPGYMAVSLKISARLRRVRSVSLFPEAAIPGECKGPKHHDPCNLYICI